MHLHAGGHGGGWEGAGWLPYAGACGVLLHGVRSAACASWGAALNRGTRQICSRAQHVQQHTCVRTVHGVVLVVWQGWVHAGGCCCTRAPCLHMLLHSMTTQPAWWGGQEPRETGGMIGTAAGGMGTVAALWVAFHPNREGRGLRGHWQGQPPRARRARYKPFASCDSLVNMVQSGSR
jgi:hypothetical protein